MNERRWTLPNQITALRLCMIPFLWILAILELRFYVGLCLILAVATDLLDGYLARRLQLESEFGSRLDSAVDIMLVTSGLIWLYLFNPEVFRNHTMICSVAIGFSAFEILVGWVKFHQLGNLHLYSVKLNSLWGGVFLICTLLRGSYSPLAFYIGITLWLISSAEALIINLVSSKVSEHIGSIIFLRRNGA